MDATCTNCGRPCEGPALSLTMQAERVTVHQGRVFRAATCPTFSDWLICQDCLAKANVDVAGLNVAGLNVAGFIRTVANDLAKKTGREA